VSANCSVISDAAMAAVYKSLVTGRFCALRHQSPSPYVSPHYGSRTITIYVGEHWFEVSDSSGHLLDKASHKRFYEMADAITSAGQAAGAQPPSSATVTLPPSP